MLGGRGAPKHHAGEGEDMSVFQKLKVAVVGLVIGGMGVGAAWNHMMGSGKVHIVVNEGQQVKLFIDGQSLSPASSSG